MKNRAFGLEESRGTADMVVNVVMAAVFGLVVIWVFISGPFVGTFEIGKRLYKRYKPNRINPEDYWSDYEHES